MMRKIKNKILFILNVITLLFLFDFSFLDAQNRDEKELLEVSSMHFSGNNFFSNDFIVDVFSTKQTSSWISKTLYNTIGGLGSPPNYFDSRLFTEDIIRIKKLYNENGFLSTKIDTLLLVDTSKKSLNIEVMIEEGYRTEVDTIIYFGLDNLEHEIKNEIFSNSYLKLNGGYSSDLLLKEIKRILKILSNSGYPTAQIENKSVTVAKVLSTNNYRILIPINTGQKLFFGQTKIKLESNKEQNILEDIIIKQLDYKEGESYNIDKKIESERNLSRLGVFEYARIEGKFPGEGDSSSSVLLNVLLKPKNRYELAPEIFVNSQDYAFNLGLGLNGIVRNIGGGAQSIVGSIRGRAQSFSQGNIEFALQWIQPYLFSNKFTLNITSSFRLDFRNEYRQNVLQNKVSVTSKFNRYNFFNFGIIDWDLERAELTFLVDTNTVSSALLKEQFLKLEEPQFNSILGITLQHDNTNDIFSPTSGEYLSISIEEAGLIPSILIKDRDKLRYSKFFKITTHGKLFKPISSEPLTIVASRLKFGYAKQYGERQEEFLIPLTRRFFAGGSGSVRGWRARELGSILSPEFGGKLIIESNFELRTHATDQKGNILFLDANKIWLVFFVDFGNIWNSFSDIHLSEMAIASGVGFRYDAFIGPIRFDFGFRVYDPYAIGNKFILKRKFFSEIVSKGQIHFGIGHAF